MRYDRPYPYGLMVRQSDNKEKRVTLAGKQDPETLPGTAATETIPDPVSCDNAGNGMRRRTRLPGAGWTHSPGGLVTAFGAFVPEGNR